MGIEGVEYGRGHERLEELLRSVDRPGNYCVGGRLYVPMPRLQVKGVGDLSFPIPPAQIEALIAAAERAPYGKGTRTLVDASVRDCWQIDARNVRLLGRGWPASLAEIMGLTADGLGLPVDGLSASPYKLLVYERGGFFAEHRDTEKVPGMVATLIPGDLLLRQWRYSSTSWSSAPTWSSSSPIRTMTASRSMGSTHSSTPWYRNSTA